MQAIILAAGMGKRLGVLTQENTKCMVKVNGVPLIDRLLRQLISLNLKRIIIVIGYKGSKLKDYITQKYKGVPIEYIYNDVYDKTNNIYSLSLAKKQFQEDDTLLVESDLIFDDRIFPMIINHPHPNLAMVAKYECWMDGTVVKIDEDCNIINFIPKKDFNFNDINSYYKTINVYKFSRDFINTSYVPFLDAYTSALGNNEYYEQVLRVITLLDKCDLKALPITVEKWYEIDDIQDLDIAETIFADMDQNFQLIQKRYGGFWRFPELLDFCYLVNPYFPSAQMKEEMKANFDILLSEYPSGLRVNTLLAGKYFSISQKFIVVGNGAAELIKCLMDSLEGNIGNVLPTFEEYPNRYPKEKIISFRPENIDFSYTADDLITFFQDKNIRSLIIINPDNPSGNMLSFEELLILLDWTQKNNIYLIIDESFVDFSEKNCSLLQDEILKTYSNLVVIKSISKSYGVPGIRLGVLATSDIELLKIVRQNISIWNINSFGEFYMQIYGKYTADYQNACEKFKKERSRFWLELQQIAFLRVIPSQANYFLCEVLTKYSSELLAELLLKNHNILIKNCKDKKGFRGQNYIRLAIRNSEDNNRLIYALKQM